MDDKRNVIVRWLFPDPVARLPREQRLRIALSVIVLILGGTFAARVWLGFESWTAVFLMLAGAGLAVAAIEWWARRVGRRVSRAELRLRHAEETLAIPAWKLVLVNAVIFGTAGIVPQLLFADWESGRWQHRAQATLVVMLPIAVGVALLMTHWERKRAAAQLGHQG